MKSADLRSLILMLGLLVLAGCAGSGSSADPRLTAHAAGGDVIGKIEVHEASKDDTLIELARSYDLGYVELAAANPDLDPWLPGAGTKVVLPTAYVLPPGPREGLVINLAEQRLYYFDGTASPVTYPIGVGREGWETPLGATKVVRKRENPTWHPPVSARKEDPTLPKAVPPGPENPLGSHAMYLGWAAYLVHGTNEPYGIGRRVSRGCIRLYPEDIAQLYAMVPKGTAVQVIDEPVKLGSAGGELYLEAHPSLRQAQQIEDTGRFDHEPLVAIEKQIVDAAAGSADRLDWDVIAGALKDRQGIPVQITRSSDPQPADVAGYFDSMVDRIFGEEKAEN